MADSSKNSCAELFRKRDKAAREAILAGLTEKELKALYYDWEFWARPNQKLPAGDWQFWVVKAGRGFGKTRVGAETVRIWVRDFPYVNLIAPTADDVRNIMIEGESGILAVCPPGERPRYQPSTRSLKWPNGAKSLLFSADEPDRLRGKQHMKLWCLVADTLVMMADGAQKRIADIKIGESISSPAGAQRVLGSALTRKNSEIYKMQLMDGRSIIGTGNHPVWIENRGFVGISECLPGDIACVINVWNGPASGGIVTKKATTLRWFGCRWQFGKAFMGRFRRALTFTIRMKTKETGQSKISNYYPTQSTAHGTLRQRLVRTGRELYRQLLKLASAIWSSGFYENYIVSFAGAPIIRARSIQAGSAQVSVWRQRGVEPLNQKGGAVNTAVGPTRHESESRYIVLSDAITSPWKLGQIADKSEKFHALNAGKSLRAQELTHDSVPERVPLLTMLTIDSVEKLPKREDVYDIAVEGHEFFANGILVHNCDEVAVWRYPDSWDQAMFGLRLGTNPQAIVTTTPKPVKHVKELLKDSRAVITVGTTYDNADNLAPAFVARIITKYEGTRLGRQELNAELLEDRPGALWNHTNIDDLRVAKLPDENELERICVGVDPSVADPDKSAEEPDECGIVIAARDKRQPPHFYVFADTSPSRQAFRSHRRSAVFQGSWVHHARHTVHDILTPV